MKQMPVGDSKCFSNLRLGRYPDGSQPFGGFPPRHVSRGSKGICQISGQALISFYLGHIVAKNRNIALASNEMFRDLPEDVHHIKVNYTTFQRERNSPLNSHKTREEWLSRRIVTRAHITALDPHKGL